MLLDIYVCNQLRSKCDYIILWECSNANIFVIQICSKLLLFQICLMMINTVLLDVLDLSGSYDVYLIISD